MTTHAFIATLGGIDFRGWFTQPYRTAYRYGYWRGCDRTPGKTVMM